MSSSLNLVQMQLSLSTAEDERNYFTGSSPVSPPEPDPEAILPPGIYRVIDGEIFRVSAGAPDLK